MGFPLWREINEKKKKKKDSFAFQSVRVRFRESIRLQECVNTEFSWEAKKGNWRKSLLEESCTVIYSSDERQNVK